MSENPTSQSESTTANSTEQATSARKIPLSEPLNRLRASLLALESQARTAVQKRLDSVKADELLARFPERVQGEVDAVLDRVGLVRKARVEAQAPTPSTATPGA
jgi:hypothetical protein